ncbi:hypothetical protein [Rhodococcus sp. USK13]|nr:hypothetical protein [Rhodococcus sp. USK13]
MTDDEIDTWVAKVGRAPDDVFARLVSGYASALRRQAAAESGSPGRVANQ